MSLIDQIEEQWDQGPEACDPGDIFSQLLSEARRLERTTTLFQILTANLDKLGIEYTWDPDFEDHGVLIIDSSPAHGKYHHIGMIFTKATGQLHEIEFGETLSEADDFSSSAKRKEVPS